MHDIPKLKKLSAVFDSLTNAFDICFDTGRMRCTAMFEVLPRIGITAFKFPKELPWQMRTEEDLQMAAEEKDTEEEDKKMKEEQFPTS